MANSKLPARVSRLEKVLRPAIDKVVETRYLPAVQLVERTRWENPTAAPDAIADRIIARYTKELAAVAALTGGAAAIPGAGTGTAIASSGLDLAYSMTKLGEMILAIGVAYGHTARSIEERRTFILSVMGIANGVATSLDGVAGRIGAVGGASLVARIPDEALVSINNRLGAKVLAKFAAEQGAVRLGRVIPFGIGAGIGAGGSVLLVRSVGRAAKRFFADASQTQGLTPPASAPVGAVIDVRAVETSAWTISSTEDPPARG